MEMPKIDESEKIVSDYVSFSMISAMKLHSLG